MSRNELDERIIQAKFENAVGERVDFGSRPRCPKDNSLRISRQFCRGKESLVPAGGKVTCPLEDEHLHAICECGNHWIERPADDEANANPDSRYELADAPDVLAAMVKMAGGELTIPADLLAEVQRDGPAVELEQFGYGVRLKLKDRVEMPPPNTNALP